METTFQYDENLPSLPLPPLDQTLKKYLHSVKPFVSSEEFEKTQKTVGEFGNGVGKTLHAKLVERAKTRQNWIEEWWEKMYLDVRLPLGVLQNITGAITTQEVVWPPREGTQLKRAAIFYWHQLKIYVMCRKETVPVEKNRAGTKIFSMDQYKKIYHCCREPGIEHDSLFHYFKTEREGPCPNHVHVICNGHVFKMVPFDEEGELLTAPEIERQLASIKERSQKKGQGIGTLTADDRPTYAKALKHLLSLDQTNRANVEIIKSSIMGFVLDAGNPSNNLEALAHGVAGPYPYNRWFDKANNIVVTENGIVTNSADHAPFDAMAIVITSTFIFQQIVRDRGDWPEGQTVKDVRADHISTPTELVFTTDQQVEDDIAHAAETYHNLASNFDVGFHAYPRYGKNFLKEKKIHPDTTLQLALQLGYYIMNNKPGAAYETATTRQFYHGRTETMRSCTPEVVDWCKTMTDSKAEPSHQLTLLRRAHDTHNTLMEEAANGQGLDRHLFGLYCVAEEMELPVPDIYTDKAYTASGGGGNFPLSTSTLGHTPILGSMSPMMHDGYMCCYRFGNNDIHISASAFKSSSETDPHRLLECVTAALNKIGNLLELRLEEGNKQAANL